MRVVNFAFWIILFVGAVFAADDEVYVLFRGIHYTNGQVVPPKANIEGVINQDCEAPYVSTANISSASALRKSTRLQSLRDTGVVMANGQKFPSMYDCMAQRYVDGYKSFLQAVGDPNSALRAELLNRCNLTPDNIFLISTSLSAYVGLKYAAGICSTPSDNRREPVNDNQLVDPILGYLDVFVIPAREIGSLYPYFVLEEFARHHIAIPYSISKDKRKDYTLAEEVIVPFLIPAQYHKWRFTVDVTEKDAKFSKPDVAANRKWGDVEWIRYHMGKFAKDVESNVSQWLTANRKKRVYLGPLTHQLEKRSYHLVPSQAVAIRGRIEQEFNTFGHLFFDSGSQRIIVNREVNLGFIAAYALQQLGYRGYPMEIDMPFSLDSEKTAWFSVVLEAPNIERLVLQGADTDGVRDLIEYDEENVQKGQVPAEYFLQEFPFWQTPHKSFFKLVGALSKRNRPLVFDVTGQSLDPESYDALQELQHVTVEDSNRHDDEYYANEWWEDMGNQQGGYVEDMSTSEEKDSYSSDSLDDLADRLEDMHVGE